MIVVAMVMLMTIMMRVACVIRGGPANAWRGRSSRDRHMKGLSVGYGLLGVPLDDLNELFGSILGFGIAFGSLRKDVMAHVPFHDHRH